MADDSELLRRYADSQSEEAFADLVQRHLNLVYGVALRRVGGDAALAKDVTQLVFVALARRARALSRRPVLASWLYVTARYISGTVVRSERRRRAHEQAALGMNEPTLAVEAPARDAWTQLRPVLDQALDELNERDRQAILLRFFESRPYAEIGTKLRLSEDAARMRVERALDKMNGLLTSRGVTSTTAALAIALADEAGAVAPAGLATLMAGGALSSVAISTGAGALAVTFAHFVGMTKSVGGIATVAVVGLGVTLYENRELRSKNDSLGRTSSEQAALMRKVATLEKQLAVEQGKAVAADQDNLALLKVVQSWNTQKLPSPEAKQENAPITRDGVEARYKHGQQLAREGDLHAALDEFLWCYDTGMPQVSGYAGVRSSFLLSSIMGLAQRDPVALAALRDRRDAAEKRLLASGTDYQAAMDFSALNRVLKENDRTLAVYDQLPAGDPRRRAVAGAAYDQFVTVQRYTDAIVARPYSQMNSVFDHIIEPRPELEKLPNAAMIKKVEHDGLIRRTALDIEALAGAGDGPHARALADKLFLYDGSGPTRTLVLEHLTRAGHADLLTVSTPP